MISSVASYGAGSGSGLMRRAWIRLRTCRMWEPFRLSIEAWAPDYRIVYDKFHVMQRANDAIDEVRWAAKRSAR
jgi:transposase